MCVFDGFVEYVIQRDNCIQFLKLVSEAPFGSTLFIFQIRYTYISFRWEKVSVKWSDLKFLTLRIIWILILANMFSTTLLISLTKFSMLLSFYGVNSIDINLGKRRTRFESKLSSLEKIISLTIIYIVIYKLHRYDLTFINGSFSPIWTIKEARLENSQVKVWL